MKKRQLTERWSNTMKKAWLAVFLCGVFGATGAWAAITITPSDLDQSVAEDFGTHDIDIHFNYVPGNGTPDVISLSVSDSTLFTATMHIDSGDDQVIRLTSKLNRFGTNTVTLIATNSAPAFTNTFEVIVTPVNDAPTITGPAEPLDSIDEDTSTAALDFIVYDVDNVISNLLISKTSSDTNLLPLANIVADGSGSNRTVTLTPFTNLNGVVDIELIVSDGSLSATNEFSLTVDPVDDPPVLTGLPAQFVFNDNIGGTNLFSGVSVEDVDLGNQANDKETLIVSVEIPSDNGVGSFSGLLSTTGTPDVVSTALRNLVFTPFENRTQVGNTNVLGVTIFVEAERPGKTEGSVENNTQLHVVSVNDPPTVTLSVSPDNIADNVSVKPFLMTVTDLDDGETFTVTIWEDNTPANRLGTLTVPSPATGTKGQVEAAVGNVRYTPFENRVSGATQVVFKVSVEDKIGVAATNNAILTIHGANDSPSIEGVSLSEFRINDDQQVRPFPSVEISDPENDNLTVTLSVSDNSLGSLSTNSFSNVSPSNVTALIQAVVFDPADNVIAVGDHRTVTLTITVEDHDDSVSNNDTEIIITGINGAPVISVPKIQPLAVSPVAPRPFLSVHIADETNDVLTLTIELDDSGKGSLSNQLTGVDFISATGTLSEINMLLTNLIFNVNAGYGFPPNPFGDTTFTLTVEDDLGNITQKTLRIILLESPRNILVTRNEDDEEPGSLRYALGIAAHNDVITFAFSDNFPVTIALQNTISLNKHLTFKGPGADKLIISGDSDSDFVPDTQIFQIGANVEMEGVALEYGTALFGGAVSVEPGWSLTMRYCRISDSTADLWGGAIDVEQGQLLMENCLLENNSVSVGYGGGAVSLWTDMDCAFINTTFSSNRQDSTSGWGGGALYIENYTPSTYLNVDVVHCTFSGNKDEAIMASSALVSGAKAILWPFNSIFSDGLGYNLEVYGSGDVLSFGGNISDDSTYTPYLQSGDPNRVFLLDVAGSDQTDVNTRLGTLTLLEGPTAVYPLQAGSPAIDGGEGAITAIDQRGVIRDDAQPDCGAFEYNALQRIVINEIQPNDVPADFIEFYIPRDAVNTDLDGYELYVNGTNIHTFSCGVLKPGAGIIVAASTNVTAAGPPPTPVVTPITHPLILKAEGLIELLSPDLQVVLSCEYNDNFAALSNSTVTVFDPVNYPDHSQTLSPQFRGFSYIPHGLLQNISSSAGYDTKPQAFGSPNASAVAVPDRFVVGEDYAWWLDVLENDLDADRTDTLIVTGLPFPDIVDMTTNGAIYSVSVSNSPAVYDPTNLPPAIVDIQQFVTNQPGLPDGVWYDPRGLPLASNIQQLAEGAELAETFSYSITDMGTGTVTSITNQLGSNLLQTVSDHRLTTNDVVILSGTDLYDGTNSVLSVVDSNTVEISTSVGTAVSNGTWMVFRSTDSADVHLTVIGANDAPEPEPDEVRCGEEDVLRILADPDYLGTTHIVFETDADYPVPVGLAETNLLANDSDIDTDDNESTLQVVGVVGGTPLQTLSALEADVVLDIRADRAETSIIYNPRVSSVLNGLAIGESTNDIFRYVVMDSHGALGTGTVTVVVSGVNDTPVGEDDPGNLNPLLPFVGTGTVVNVISNLTVLDAVGAGSGLSNRMDARVVIAGYGEADSLVVPDLWFTSEDDKLSIASSNIWGNDFDFDLSDQLVVTNVFTSSLGVPVYLTNGNLTVLYDAPASDTLNALARGELLMDSFEVVVADQFAASVTNASALITNTVAVLVVGVNDTPVAQDDEIDTFEDLPLVFNPIYYPTNKPALWDYDVDINGVPPDNALWIVPVTNEITPWLAMFSISSNTIFYDPAVSAGPEGTMWLDGLSETNTADDTLTYTLTDQSFVFACDDLFRVETDGSGFELDVMANDRNYNQRGGEIIISAVGLPGNGGTVEININSNSLTYTPEVSFVGDEVFTYTITDPYGNIDRARVTVRVTTERLNGHIQANDDHFSVATGELVALDVLANDNRLTAPGSPFIITQVTRTNDLTGRVQLIGNTLFYSNTNSLESGTFDYEISAGGTARATASVTVTVINRDKVLPTGDDCFSVRRDSANTPLDVLANDKILPDSPDVSLSSISLQPSHGSVSVNTNENVLEYSPAAGFVGMDLLEYSVTDGLGGTGSGTVRIRVGSVIAQEDTFTVPSDGTPVDLDVLINDSILPKGLSGSLIVSGISTQSVSVGTITNANSHLLFTPGSNQYGTATFTYKIQDEVVEGNPRTATATVTVTVVDPGAHANPDHMAVLTGKEAVSLDVLNNDNSTDDAHAAAVTGIGTGVDAPSAGGLVVVSDGGTGLVYTPLPGFTGEETFTYFMSDSLGTDSAKVVVQVRPPEIAGCDDVYKVYFDGANTPAFTLPVLMNDTLLPNAGSLQIEGIGMDDSGGTNAPSHNGTVDVSIDGFSLEYTPAFAWAGESNSLSYIETFTYEISDGSERRVSSQVSVQVLQRAEALEPEANDDFYSVERNSTNGTPYTANVLPVLLNDGILPATASSWTITSVGSSKHGGIATHSGPNILFTPEPGFVGTETFTYSVSDGLGGTASANVSVIVGDILLNPDCFAVLSGTIDNEIPVLINDGILPGPEFDLMLYTNWISSLGGAVNIESNMLYYTPNASNTDWPYVETLHYTVIDDSGIVVTQQVEVMVVETGDDRDTATVSILVQGVNDLPVITNLAQQLYTDDKTTIDPMFPTGTVYDVDLWYQEHLETTITIDDPTKAVLMNLGNFTNGTDGVYGLGGTGSNITASLRNLTFEPIENQFTVGTTGTVTLTILVQDPFGGAATNIVDIRVIPVNDPPIISGTRAGQEVYHELRLRPFSSVTITEVDDLTLQPLTVQVALDAPTNGVLTHLGVFADLGGGVYSATGITRAQATAALQSMVFEPMTDGRVTKANPSETTRFTISVDDGGIGPPVPRDPIETDDITTVIAIFPLMDEIFHGDGDNIGEFGAAVGSVRDWVAVGAPTSDIGGTDRGAVIMYSRNLGGLDAWGEHMTLFASDPANGNKFGYAVAMSGDTLVAGAPDNEGKGAAYVYQQNQGGSDNWGFVKKLIADDGVSGDFFGCSVTIDGDTIAVGDIDKERVYLFDRHADGSNQWAQVHEVNASNGFYPRDFGYSISLHRDALIVGAPLDDTYGDNTGVAYMFERNAGAWSPVQTLYPTGPDAADRFGFSVDIYEDLLVVGSPRDDNAYGAAFIFANTGNNPGSPWELEKKLVATERRYDDLYGSGVTIDRDLVVVGVPGFEIGETDDGEAWLYGRHEGGTNQWGLIERFAAPVENTAGDFGAALALDDYTLAIGSPGSGVDSVSIYRLKFNDGPAVATAIPDQTAYLFELFELAVPADTFGDPDIEDTLIVTAVLNSTWLSFDLNTQTFSGTPLDTGTVAVLLIAIDPDGESATNAFNVLVSTNQVDMVPAKTKWNAIHFGGDALVDPDAMGKDWSDDADIDGDGLINIAEYVFGTDPTVFGTLPDHELVIVYDRGLDRVTVSYNRRSDDPSLTYVLQMSNDLQTWSIASPITEEMAVPLMEDGMERVIFSFGGMNASSCFRVLVTY